VRGVIQGDSRPRDFIPRLVDLFMAGRMPLDRLITRYDFPDIYPRGRRRHLGRCDNAIHVGHSTGGGEVAHYLGQHGESRVAKAALISAVPPLMVKTAANPLGLPKEVFDGF
jgi:pimeloyl-ACP methyl ester carboxylesterase